MSSPGHIATVGFAVALLNSLPPATQSQSDSALLFSDCLIVRASSGAIVDHVTAFDDAETWRRVVRAQIRYPAESAEGPSWTLQLQPGEVSGLLGAALRAAAEVAPTQKVSTCLSVDEDTGVFVYLPSRQFRAWDQELMILPGAGDSAVLVGWNNSQEIRQSAGVEGCGLGSLPSIGYLLASAEGIADSQIDGPHVVLDVAPGVDTRSLVVAGKRLCERLNADAIALTVRPGDRGDTLADFLQWPHLLAQAGRWGVDDGDEILKLWDLLSAVSTPVVTSQAMADRLAQVHDRLLSSGDSLEVDDILTADLIGLCGLVECWMGRNQDSGDGAEDALTESLRRLVVPLSRALAERFEAQEDAAVCTQNAAWLLSLVVCAGYSGIQVNFNDEEWGAIQAVSLAVDQELGLDKLEEVAFQIEAGRSLATFSLFNPPSAADDRLVRFLPAFRRAACADGVLDLTELAVLHSRLRWESDWVPDDSLREILRNELVPLARVVDRVGAIEQLLEDVEWRNRLKAMASADVLVLSFWLGQAGGI